MKLRNASRGLLPLALTVSVSAIPLGTVFAQDLTIYYETTRKGSVAGVEHALRNVAERLNAYSTGQESPKARLFSGAPSFKAFGYNSSCEEVKERAIVMMTPAKWLQCQREVGAFLTPLLIVEKGSVSPAFYSAAFIVSKASPINTPHLDSVKTLLLVAKGSASGYVAPLVRLWETGELREPTEAAAKARLPEHVVLAGDQDKVIDRVRRSPDAIGAIGDYMSEAELDARGVRIIERYYQLPQTMIAASTDLLTQHTHISAVLKSVFRRDSTNSLVEMDARTLETSAIGMSGVTDFNQPQYVNAYASLARMLDLVEGRERTYVIRGNERVILLGLLAATAAVLVLGAFAVGHYVRRASAATTHLFLVFAVLLVVVWCGLLWRPVLSQNWPSIGAAIAAASLIGSTLRILVRRAGLQPTSESTTVTIDPPQELVLGLLLSFAVLVVLAFTDSTVHGGAQPPSLDYRRAVLTYSALALGVNFLMKETVVILAGKVAGIIKGKHDAVNAS